VATTLSIAFESFDFKLEIGLKLDNSSGDIFCFLIIGLIIASFIFDGTVALLSERLTVLAIVGRRSSKQFFKITPGTGSRSHDLETKEKISLERLSDELSLKDVK
jgi:hypothetical protein